jgi:hypothetical protein
MMMLSTIVSGATVWRGRQREAATLTVIVLRSIVDETLAGNSWELAERYLTP